MAVRFLTDSHQTVDKVTNPLYDEIRGYDPETIVMDAGYKTPSIAHELLDDGVQPLFTYKRPMTEKGREDPHFRMALDTYCCLLGGF